MEVSINPALIGLGWSHVICADTVRFFLRPLPEGGFLINQILSLQSGQMISFGQNNCGQLGTGHNRNKWVPQVLNPKEYNENLGVACYEKGEEEFPEMPGKLVAIGAGVGFLPHAP